MRRRRLVPPVLLAALASSFPLLAGPASIFVPAREMPVRKPYTPAEVKAERLKLSDAIQLTLENAAAMRRARAEAEIRRGALQEATGLFDTKIAFSPTYSQAIGTVIGGTLKSEQDKRELLSILAFEFQQVAADIQRNAELNLGLVFPPCKGFELGSFGDTVAAAGDSTPLSGRITVRGDNFTAFLNNGRLVAAIISGQLICLPDLSGSSVAANIAKAQAETLAILRRTNPDAPTSEDDDLTKELLGLAEVFRDISRRANRGLVNLGDLPLRDYRDVFGIDLQLPIPFRNGMVVAPLLQLSGTRDVFQGKSYSAGFGGKGIPTQFTSILGASLTAPVGQGSGISVAAPELAAKLNHAAALEDEAQAAAVSVRDTVLAYWELAAAQDRLALLERSRSLQGQIADMSQALVDAEELPRIEMDRIHGRSADLDGQIESARQSLVAARVSLARTIGLSVTDLEAAPLAADALPEPPGVPKLALADLVRLATRARSDVKATVRREEASDVFVRAARFDVKPKMDFILQADIRGIYEELGKHPLYLKGYYFAMTGSRRSAKVATGPSISLNFRFSTPLPNNAALGRLVQSESLLDQSQINRKNLERIVESRTVELVGSLIRSAQEVEARRAANLRYDETIQTSFDLYRAGEQSLLDAILTERDLTASRLDTVNARLAYATRMTQLRFETGSLLSYTSSGGVLTIQEVTPVGFSFYKYD